MNTEIKHTPGPEPRIELPDYDKSFVPKLRFGSESFRVETWTGEPMGLEACKDFNSRIATLRADKAELLERLAELKQAAESIDTRYGTSDFLPGDKARRYWAAIDQARALIAKHTKP